MLKIGDKAPDFTLPSDEGEEISLANFKGKRVLLFFYPKANTSG
jgi:thioredoxin-dependent peroxiredoxin